jgi:DNA-binding response OmpR family regulator
VKTREKTSLLIVDDDAPIRKLLERVAVRAGFEVGLAKDGVEALEMLEKRPYSIAIIDLMMPRLSGYELVQKISAMNPRPVILVATALTNGDVSKIDDTLVRRVIRKPFDVQSVAETLIETAKHIAEKQAAAEKGVPVAPPDAAIIRVSPEEFEEETDEQKKKDEPKQPNAKSPN